MAKTKTTSRRRAKKPVTEEVAPVEKKATACDASCWLCWLFKLMITLFLLMIVFWLGFCFGALSGFGGHEMKGKGMYSLSEKKTCGGGYCGLPSGDPHAGHNMSTGEAMSMDEMMSHMMSSLEGKTGADFDREFLIQMIVHHEGAVEMAQEVLEKSTRPELRTFAQEIIDAQSAEINQMKAWQTAWSN